MASFGSLGFVGISVDTFAPSKDVRGRVLSLAHDTICGPMMQPICELRLHFFGNRAYCGHAEQGRVNAKGAEDG